MTLPGDELHIECLRDELVAETARLLGAAMQVDPAYRYLFADPSARATGLPDFFARNLRLHVAHRCSYVARDASGALLATVTLRPPGGIHISKLTMLRRGLLPFALAHGRESVRRLFWLKATYDALEAELATGAPHRYVHMMAVAPERQGTGIGGRLLQRVFALQQPAAQAMPAVLTTHLPRNVTFYRRAGFHVISERALHPPHGEPYTVWSMSTRPPA